MTEKQIERIGIGALLALLALSFLYKGSAAMPPPPPPPPELPQDTVVPDSPGPY